MIFMIYKNELIKEQKDCADMLGMSLNEYQDSLKNTKVPVKEKDTDKVVYDNSILKSFGIKEKMLKKKNYNL